MVEKLNELKVLKYVFENSNTQLKYAKMCKIYKKKKLHNTILFTF